MAFVTVAIPEELVSVLSRARADHGANVLEEVVVNWLNDRKLQQKERDAFALRDAIVTLTPAEIQAIPPAVRAKLGL